MKAVVMNFERMSSMETLVTLESDRWIGLQNIVNFNHGTLRGMRQ